MAPCFLRAAIPQNHIPCASAWSGSKSGFSISKVVRMNSYFFQLFTRITLVSAALLAGCSTTVRGTKKLEGYDLKISAPSVMWQSNFQLSFQIKKTAGLAALAAITDANKAESREHLGQLMGLLTSQSSRVVSAKLKATGLAAFPVANDAPSSPRDTPFLIKIYPAFAGSECSAVSCSHDVGLIVIAWDFALKKNVWQGDFKVGAPLGGAISEQLLDSFATSLVNELKNAKLL